MNENLSYALSTARGVAIEYDLSGYRREVKEIRQLDFSHAADASLSDEAAGGDPDEELVTAFALVAEICRRRLGMAPFDEQLIAAIAMHRGRLVQMQTGEGKTIAAVFPACLLAMAGDGVHVMTANDYLARRDAEWMRPVYECMGLSVASVGESTDAHARRAAYLADVTYLTAREAGFDFLRDQMKYDASELVHRDLSAAIVDEADFILIDEARIPLVIAGTCGTDGVDLGRVDRIARALKPGIDYDVDREGRRISIRLQAHGRIESGLGIVGIHEERGAEGFARVHAALHAHALLTRDVDYVVKQGRIELVDGFTGRVADRRQWPYGIQAALESKEGLEIGPEGRVFGSITIQDFMGLYGTLAAMTATAVPSAEELSGLYGLTTTIVPTVKPVIRIDEPDMLFGTHEEKMSALVQEISTVHASGRPILVGTASVRESEELSGLLRKAGVFTEVLNAKNDEREAELIAQAGRMGAVTISTNMAGRGIDIKLAGGDGGQKVPALGGLYVIGTNRHESRRVDDQLRGRSGRQGEPGSSRFFISLEDPLFERYGVREFLPDCPVTDRRVLAEVNRAQSIIEAQNHRIRRDLRKYTRLVELDRRRVRGLRDGALRHGELPPTVEEACTEEKLRPLVIQIFLTRLDRFWADHLAFVEDVREGIGLERFAGRDPGLEYIHRVGSSFESGLADLERQVASDCEALKKDPSGRSLERSGLERPSSTWTYQIDDTAAVTFNLSMIATSNIGAAAMTMGPLAIVTVIGTLMVRLLKAVQGLLRGRKRVR